MERLDGHDFTLTEKAIWNAAYGAAYARTEYSMAVFSDNELRARAGKAAGVANESVRAYRVWENYIAKKVAAGLEGE